jgi:hypothetical protein
VIRVLRGLYWATQAVFVAAVVVLLIAGQIDAAIGALLGGALACVLGTTVSERLLLRAEIRVLRERVESLELRSDLIMERVLDTNRLSDEDRDRLRAMLEEIVSASIDDAFDGLTLAIQDADAEPTRPDAVALTGRGGSSCN